MTDATKLIDLQIMWNRLIAVVERRRRVGPDPLAECDEPRFNVVTTLGVAHG